MGILGRLLAGSKKVEPAPESREHADEPIAHGQQLEDANDFTGAEKRFRDAVALSPSYPRAHLNLGNALHKQGRLEEAAAAHRAAIALDPSFVGAHFNLGMVLIQLREIVPAKRHLEKALELDPGLADAAVNLAQACAEDGDTPGARRQLERAVRIDPAHAGARGNLGNAQLEAGELDAAQRSLREALDLDPRSARALAGLARIDVQRARAGRADAAFRRALEIDPADASVWSSYLFSLNLRDDVDAPAVAKAHFAFGEAVGGQAPRRSPVRSRAPRVRVGYVSGDLMKHPVGLFLRPLLRHHDRERFETFCYTNSHIEDELSAELRGASDHWRSIAGREDPWAEALIRADALDILVDLSGHTARNRLRLFARRPAPVQATWLGYLNTTGLEAMDYRICDAHTDPEGATEALNAETLVRLPHSQWCYAPYYDVALDGAREAGGPVTFGSFNQFVKVSDSGLDAWCEILRRVPESRLRVHGVPPGVTAEDFRGRLEARGVCGDRVTLTGRIAIHDYFAAIRAVDIALDSMPYNGATTTLDTLWMGTPVVALRGERAIGRGSYSIARAAGLEELVAHSPAEYVEANVRLAHDAPARAALRRGLRPRLEASPLMDGPRFTRDVETCYREMLDAADRKGT